jgi:hypothetical protein
MTDTIRLNQPPEWAKYKSMDADGIWTFWSHRPRPLRSMGIWVFPENWSKHFRSAIVTDTKSDPSKMPYQWYETVQALHDRLEICRICLGDCVCADPDPEQTISIPATCVCDLEEWDLRVLSISVVCDKFVAHDMLDDACQVCFHSRKCHAEG